MSNKARCTECDWHGVWSGLLGAINPFKPGETIRGCPTCKGIDCFVSVCDEPECWEPVTCGTPTCQGYRSTCRKHGPREGARDEE